MAEKHELFYHDDKKEKWQSHEKWKQGITLVVVFALFIVAVAYLVDSSYNPFLYFRF